MASTSNKLAATILVALELASFGASGRDAGGEQQDAKVLASRLGIAMPKLGDNSACGGGSLETAIARSLGFGTRLKWKSSTNIIGREEFKFNVGVRELSYAKMQSSIQSMGKVHSTLGLIYGRVENDHTCVWLIDGHRISASSSIRSLDVDALVTQARDGLNVEVASRRRTPRKRNPGSDCVFPPDDPAAAANVAMETSTLREISEKLLPPSMSSYLASHTAERLVVLPTSSMRAIPFAALYAGNEFLVDRFALIVAPDATTMVGEHIDAKAGAAAITPGPSAATALIVGNPDLSWDKENCWADLPHAALEARFAARTLGSESIFVGPDATFANVQRRLDQDRASLTLIYFATHGYSDPTDPFNKSFLALSGHFLNANDIRRTHFTRGPIVVMSACETGLGKTFPDGIFGIEEAWRFAGAWQIVVGLWDVSDEGTQALMAELITRLKARNMIGAEFALAEAMRALKVRNPDPAIWASFGVFGQPATQ